MPYVHPQSIAGKYFIFGALASFGSPNGGPLIHGKILGPIESELSQFYLCEIYPVSSDRIAVGNQIIFALPQLVGAYLYDDHDVFVAEWAQMLRQVAHMQQEEIRQAAMQQAQQAQQSSPQRPSRRRSRINPLNVPLPIVTDEDDNES